MRLFISNHLLKSMFFLTVIVALLTGLVMDKAYEQPWPLNGKIKIMERFNGGPSHIYQYTSRWMKENGKTGPYHAFEEKGRCVFDMNNILWREYEFVINGTARCEVNGIIGEYTIQELKGDDNPYNGWYQANAAHFPATDSHPLGSVTNVMETPY